MLRKKKVLAASGGFLSDTYRESGVIGCARKMLAAVKMSIPLFMMGRRTNSSVGAYFDLITDDARMFYGDNFHFGYFKNGTETIEEAHDNHTDVVAEMAGINPSSSVLDIGCGICAPAIRITKKFGCRFTCVNISAEQVKQGRAFVEESGMAERICVTEGNALELEFPDNSFDSILCLEVAGDICVTKSQKTQLTSEIFRLLKPGGRVGFSDLVFTARPSCEEDRTMRMILYHEGAELVTDWPAIFKLAGFAIDRQMDIIGDTMKTWDHSLAVYERNTAAVERRYGRRIARNTLKQLRSIPEIMRKYGSFIVMSARKPV